MSTPEPVHQGRERCRIIGTRREEVGVSDVYMIDVVDGGIDILARARTLAGYERPHRLIECPAHARRIQTIKHSSENIVNLINRTGDLFGKAIDGSIQ